MSNSSNIVNVAHPLLRVVRDTRSKIFNPSVNNKYYTSNSLDMLLMNMITRRDSRFYACGTSDFASNFFWHLIAECHKWSGQKDEIQKILSIDKITQSMKISAKLVCDWSDLITALSSDFETCYQVL